MKLRLTEAATVEGLNVAFNYENGMERISVRLTDGAEWQEVTLDLQIARRHRHWTLLLNRRENRFAQIRVERREDEERSVAWDQPFTLAPHEVVLAPDGTRIAVSEIGARRASLLIGDRDPVEVGEGRFARWRDCLIRREKSGQLTLCQATLTRPFAYREKLQLALGETAVHDDGTRLYAAWVQRVYEYQHSVQVELTRGRLRESLALTQAEPRTCVLSEPYSITLEGYRNRTVALRVDKREAVHADGAFHLLPNHPVLWRGLIVSYDDDSHIHWIGPDGRPGWTSGYVHLSIGPPGDPTSLRIEQKDATGQTPWGKHLITIRSRSKEGLLVEIGDAPPEPEAPPPPPPPPRPWWRFWR